MTTTTATESAGPVPRPADDGQHGQAGDLLELEGRFDELFAAPLTGVATAVGAAATRNDLSKLPARVVTDSSLDTIRPHTFGLALLVLAKWPVYFCWGEGATGDHHDGRALDFMTYELGGGVNAPGPLRVEMGRQIAAFLWEHAAEFGIHYVIYRQRIISIRSNSYGPAGLWNPMEDRGSPTKNHMDHVHVSCVPNPPPLPAAPPEEDDMLTDQEIEKIAAALAKKLDVDVEKIAARAADKVWFERLPNPKSKPGATPPHASEYLVGQGNEIDALKPRVAAIEKRLTSIDSKLDAPATVTNTINLPAGDTPDEADRG